MEGLGIIKTEREGPGGKGEVSDQVPELYMYSSVRIT